jgi:iron complex outermembrane receptor protein
MLTLGSKVGYNEFSGLEVQPSGRLALSPNDSNTLWGAVSRAVRTPTRIENDARFGAAVFPAGSPPPFGDPTRPSLVAVIGNHRFDSEKVLTYELGYRTQPHPKIWVDAAGFYSRYEDLLSIELEDSIDVPASGGQPAYKLVPFVLHNELKGHSYGAELAARWQVMDAWRLQAWYAYLDISLSPTLRSTDQSSEARRGQ